MTRKMLFAVLAVLALVTPAMGEGNGPPGLPPNAGTIVFPAGPNNILRQGGHVSVPWLQRWRTKLGLMQAPGSTTRPQMLVIGNSITSGAGCGTGGDNNENAAYACAWAALLPYIMAQEHGIPVSDTTILGNQAVTVAYNTYNPQVTLGTGWGAGPADNLGGSNFKFTSGSGTGTWAYTPPAPFDHIVIGYVQTSIAGFGGSFTVDVSGQSLGTLTTAGTSQFLTHSFSVTRGSYTINLNAQNNGNFYIAYVYTYDSKTAAVDLWRSGWVGAKMSHYNSNGSVYSPLNVIDVIQPDLTYIMLTTNDEVQATPISTFLANATPVITKALQYGDVVLGVDPPPNPTGTLNQYVSALQSLATQYNLPLVNIQGRWGSYASAQTLTGNTCYTDDVHPGKPCAYDIARAVASEIGVQ